MNYLDLDLNLTKEDRLIKQTAYEFARDVMRPIAKELDEMTPEQAIAKDSPFWEFMRKAYEMGYHKVLITGYSDMELSPLQQAIIFEELGWGSVGLTVALGVACFPAYAASLVNEEELVDEIIVPYCECKDASIRGCWAITEPEHGSDTLLPYHPQFSDSSIPADCTITDDGDAYVVNGQKSSWVSCGTIATHIALFTQMDKSKGHAGSGILIVPSDLPGVTKGAPLNKLGQRDLNQGEIFFDNVRVPKKYLVIGPEGYEALCEIVLSTTTAFMGLLGAGSARAALEEAVDYTRNRVQGGKLIKEHQTIQTKLFHMQTKVETARLISRAAYIFNQNTTTPAEEYSLMAKVHGTEAAFSVAHDAVQIFGGYGMAKGYLVEKLFRDTRAMLTEDGVNDILAIAGGHKIVENYPRGD